MSRPTDSELDAYVLTRLRTIGIDLSVLPVSDPSAPCDQRRVLASARRMLRVTIPAIGRYPIDVQDVPPVSYPAALAPLLGRAEEEGAQGGGSGGEEIGPSP
jgi:hypothetical protein